MKRRGRNQLPGALALSMLVHGGGLGLAWYAVANVGEPPAMKVYAVDIVSPPPQLEGEFNAGGGGTPRVTETPAPEPVQETPPPAPEPAPPPREAPRSREPSPPAAATRPQPAAPAESRREEPKREDEPERAGGGSGEGTGASRGRNADRQSSGGENLDLQLRGAQCPTPAYCENIVRQLYRYFRPPAGSTNDVAEIYFVIAADGSATDMRVLSSSGSSRFRLAAMEAVEQAGNQKAFGPLPESFQRDRLPIAFYFRPAR